VTHHETSSVTPEADILPDIVRDRYELQDDPRGLRVRLIDASNGNMTSRRSAL
jgi:hypothetical protein